MNCPYCHSTDAPVHVHGHYQCGTCKTNLSPCCDGAIGTDLATYVIDALTDVIVRREVNSTEPGID